MPDENIKLNFLAICDNAYIDSNSKFNIMGIFDVINASGFPALNKNMFVVVNLTLQVGRYSEYIKIKRGSWEVKTSESEVVKTKKEKHQFIHNFSNVVFPEEGEYSVELYINGEIFTSDILHLKRS